MQLLPIGKAGASSGRLANPSIENDIPHCVHLIGYLFIHDPPQNTTPNSLPRYLGRYHYVCAVDLYCIHTPGFNLEQSQTSFSQPHMARRMAPRTNKDRNTTMSRLSSAAAAE